MNIRKPVDYSTMYTALDAIMTAGLPQMDLYCEIGRLVSGRVEKGAAVAASEYLCGTYPDISGFSPRNLRRMREFYRTYNDAPEVLAQAMTIGWTQNVVILDADLTLQERDWYIRAVGQFGWSKLELQRQIAANAHLENALDFRDEVVQNCCNSLLGNKDLENVQNEGEFVTPLVKQNSWTNHLKIMSGAKVMDERHWWPQELPPGKQTLHRSFLPCLPQYLSFFRHCGLPPNGSP